MCHEETSVDFIAAHGEPVRHAVTTPRLFAFPSMRQVAQEFKRKRDDVQDLAAQEREEILELAEKPLRVGAMCRSKRSMIGRNFFHGDLCHVAVYLSALPVDTIRAHHFAGVKASAFESDRLYALAGAKFRAALASAPDDTEIVARYAQSIINYLELESTQVKYVRRHVEHRTTWRDIRE